MNSLIFLAISAFVTVRYSLSIGKGSDQLFVTLYALSIYPSVNKQLIRTPSRLINNVSLLIDLEFKMILIGRIFFLRIYIIFFLCFLAYKNVSKWLIVSYPWFLLLNALTIPQKRSSFNGRAIRKKRTFLEPFFHTFQNFNGH